MVGHVARHVAGVPVCQQSPLPIAGVSVPLASADGEAAVEARLMARVIRLNTIAQECTRRTPRGTCGLSVWRRAVMALRVLHELSPNSR